MQFEFTFKQPARVIGDAPEPLLQSLLFFITQWFGVAAFFVLYTALWRLRSRVFHHREELARLEEALHRAGI